jgi:hypothetical protein
MRNVTRMLVLVAAVALLLVSTPNVDAVVGEKTVKGLPPNTSITIELPDGTKVEEETDDDGKLVYLFPKGKSTLTWAGGSKVVKAGWTAGKTAGVTAGGIVGAVAIATALDDDDSPPVSGSSPVQALSVDNSNSASALGLNIGDTIPLTCLTNTPSGITPSEAGCSCDHIHGNVNVPSQSTSASDTDPLGCGHGCVVTTSSPTVTC